MRLRWPLLASAFATAVTASSTSATVITFDDLVSGQTSYGFDGDGDGVDDVIFSTTDPFGFNTVGPGANQTYIDEPGLEGSTVVPGPDLRADFIFGAIGPLSFGFAINQSSALDPAVNFTVFDASGTQIADQTAGADFTSTGSGLSSFPEGTLTANFTGVAAYALFEFNDSIVGQRHIIDNFSGTFGSTEAIPLPAPMIPLLSGLAFLGILGRKRRRS